MIEESALKKPKIEPHRITKPIQILAVWFIALLLLVGSFLFAAREMTKPSWLSPFLVFCAAGTVPLFLVCIFLLQTRFRNELSEDKSYVLMKLASMERTKRDANSMKEAIEEFETNLDRLRQEVGREGGGEAKGKVGENVDVLEASHERVLFEMGHSVGNALQDIMLLTDKLLQESGSSSSGSSSTYRRLRIAIQNAGEIVEAMRSEGLSKTLAR